MQYVGETGRTLKTRLSEHLRNITGKLSDSFLVQHFNGADHSIDDLSVQVLQLQEPDASAVTRRDCEDFWIRSLNTAYPFGLNDKIQGYGLISKNLDPTEKRSQPYFTMPLPAKQRNARGRIRKRRYSSPILVQSIIVALQNPDCSARQVYLFLAELSIKNLALLHHRIKQDTIRLRPVTLLAIRAMLASRLKKPSIRPTDPRKKVFLPLHFPNQGMDLINGISLFQDTSLLKLIAPEVPATIRIMAAYSYEADIGKKFCTHNKFLKELTMEAISVILSSPLQM